MMSLVRAQQGEPENPVAKSNGIFLTPPFPSGSTKRHHDSKTKRPPPLPTEKKRFPSAIRTPGAPFRFPFSPGRPAQIIDVVGSSPTGGAKQRASLRRGSLFVISPPSGSTKRHHDSKTKRPPPRPTEKKRFPSAIRTPGDPFRFPFSPGRPAQIIDVVPGLLSLTSFFCLKNLFCHSGKGGFLLVDCKMHAFRL